MGKFLTTEQFIDRARNIHGNKYDYSKTEYVNTEDKVCIICPEHGEFWQRPANHLSGKGCPVCGENKRRTGIKLTTQEFIERAKKVHGDKYDYSKVNYIDTTTKICIICPEHGEFWQKPENHLKGQGCRKCADKRNREIKSFSVEDFIKKAKEIHGDKYDYSKVVYEGSNKKVCIICPEHGEFWQTPLTHVNGGCGCKECRKEFLHKKFKSNKEEFVEKARKVHGGKYDYSKVEYVNSHEKVCIICPEHGEFWQKPYAHLNGHGCPGCAESKLEREVNLFLTNKRIQFERQKTFEWLKRDKNMFLDFFLPEQKIAIECQGEQHFREGNWCKTREENKKQLKLNKERDLLKKTLCEENGISVLYFFHNNYFLDKNIYTVNNIIKNLDDLRL